jgi:nitrate/nitrite-specific signal transduction histidine kinase
MIERFLRRLSVRRRIIATVAIFLVITALSIPLIIGNQAFLVSRLQQVTEIEANIDRLLLLASTRIASSRVNLLRYSQDYAPSAYEAIDDVDQASLLIAEAHDLIENDEQKENVAQILDALVEYRIFIDQIEEARKSEEDQNAVNLEFQAYRLGNDVSQRIELIVSSNQERILDVNQAFLQDSRFRTLFIVAGYLGVLAATLFMGRLLEFSITRPVAELNNGAEAFRLGIFDTRIPIVGTDELSLLSQTFNQMAEELSKLYAELEQRVEDRTRELEIRSQYLEASSQVANAASSILNRRVLIQQVVELIQEHFNLYYVGLFEVDESTQWAVMRAGTGEGGKAMLARQHQLSIGGSSMIGWSIYNQQARIALEAGEDPVRLATEELPETRSEAAIPMRARGRVIGAISVQSTQPNAFDQDIITVLQTMADQVGVALDNAQLFTETQDALATSMRAYGQASQEAWQSLLLSQKGFGFSCDPSGVTELDEVELLPEEQLALSKSSTIVGDANNQNLQNLAIPINIRGNLIGVLDASKPVETGNWSGEEINLLETIIEQLEIALDSAQLFDQTQRRAQQERVTSEITARLHETLDPDMVLKTALREFGDRFGFTDVEIRMNPPEKAA